MASLSLGLLGPFHATLDGRVVAGLTSDRLRALLAYLVVESDGEHLRQSLATFFFPDIPRIEACSRLRYALSNLRSSIGDRRALPPLLTITRETLQFNRSRQYWLDTELFESLASEDGVNQLVQAVALYRGPFLEGIAVDSSEPFEQWLMTRREEYDRLMLSVLRRLVVRYEQRGDFVQALTYARRQLEMDPWLEVAHRQVMRALALGGQRGAALSQYHACQRVLAEELGAEPEEETSALYERIRLGQLSDSQTLGRYRVRQSSQATGSAGPGTPFVDRTDELARLGMHLGSSLAGRGRVVLLVGGPGSGKTALMNEFAVRTAAQRTGVLVAVGSCSVFGSSDVFCFPACQILNQLIGNQEFRCDDFSFDQGKDVVSPDILLDMIQLLTEIGPNLLNVYVPVQYLIDTAHRVEQWPRGSGSRDEWIGKLLAVANADTHGQLDRGAGVNHGAGERLSLSGGWPHSLRSRELEQLVSVIAALAERHPLLLLLDNLQWSDGSTLRFIDLLGTRLASNPILVIGAYRPNELLVDERMPRTSGELPAGAHRHPLQHAVVELQRRYGDITIDLDESDGRAFVNEFLGLAPNCFEDAFLEKFAQQTGGNPLLSLDLWQDLVAKKALVRDAAGLWAEGPKLDWETMPVRARATIEEAIVCLPERWQEMLAVASVQGDLFCAEVVALVSQSPVESVIRVFSGPLSHQHRMVRACGVAHVLARSSESGPSISMYRFRHHLYQVYLYQSLDDIRRMRLHESVGRALEILYQECPSELRQLAPQLAYHFEEAGMPARAAEFRKSPYASSRAE